MRRRPIPPDPPTWREGGSQSKNFFLPPLPGGEGAGGRGLLLLLLLFLLPPARAQHLPPSLTVILLPGTTLADWRQADAPLLHQKMGTGALAVMNTRTARIPPGQRRETPESALLTLGAGARARDARTTTGLGYTINLHNLDDALQTRGISPSQYRVMTATLATVDSVLKKLPVRARIIVLSPFVSDADYAAGRRLAPVLVWGDGLPAGLIYSPSTRRAGLVTNTDFAPTVADIFGVPLPTRPFGAVWSFRPVANNVAVVASLEEGALRQASAMRALPYVAVFLALVVLLGVGRFPRLAAVPPIVLLTLAFLPSVGLSLTALMLALLRPRWATPALTLVLTGDLLLGNPLMKAGLLGYSAVEGARYYGIGNEAMGVLVGAWLATAARWRGRGWMILTALAFVTALVGLPQLGAKAGGLLVCVIAFGTWALETTGVKLTARRLALIGGAAILLLLAALLTDTGGSHFGELAARVKSGGVSELWDVAARKLAVEGRLLTHSAWTILLAVSVWGLWRLRQTTSDALRRAAGVALAACLALNDAGVVAAALCGTVLWSEAMQTKKARASEEARA